MNPRTVLAILALVLTVSCWSRVTFTTGSTVTAVPVAAILLAAIAALSLAGTALAVRSLAGFRSSPWLRTAT